MQAEQVVLACQLYQREFEKALEELDYSDIDFITFPPRYGRAVIGKAAYKTLDRSESYKEAHIFGCQCVPYNKSSPSRFNVHPASQCFEYFLPDKLIEHFQRERNYLITPGWLVNWPQWMNIWGFDRSTAPEFFAEFADHIMLLDTGVYDAPNKALEDFANFVQLPHVTLPVGIEFFKLRIRDAVEQSHKGKQDQILNKMYQQTASYAMALDLLSVLTQATSQSHAIDLTLELFMMLFGAETTAFASVRDGTIQN